jgi:hypothetical protein
MIKRLLVAAGTLVVLAAPVSAATAAVPAKKADKREAQKECRAERGTTDATREAFKTQYRNFGACVSQNAKEAKAERKAASQTCREERGDTTESREAFAEKYGTNHNKRNAFGKCVSQQAKAGDDEDAEGDDAEVEDAEGRGKPAEHPGRGHGRP